MFKSLWNKLTGRGNIDKNPAVPKSFPSSASLSSGNFTRSMVNSLFTGEKYPGGIGDKLDFFYIDYWTLRRHSYRLFTENRYAAGLIRRLLTNEIHRGLTLEATPNGDILDIDDDEINDWTDDVEAKFEIWGDNKELVSYNHQFTFGQQQIEIRKSALLSGDVLVVLRQHPVTRTPTIEVIDGINIRTPVDYKGKNKIRHGVELDSKKRHVAYHVLDDSSKTGMTRLPANGPKSGRKIAWMVYGHRIRVNDVRGMPALGIIIQALKELDRYSDAEQRAAVLNAVLALFVKKSEDKLGSRPLTGRAVRRDTETVDTSSDTSPRTFNIAQQIPGVVIDELQYGEEPTSFATARPNINYHVFEEAMMASFAWVNEIPPNIYRLAFSSNYSASGAEINELRLYLDKIRYLFAADFNKPFYKEWLISMTLTDLISAPGLLEAWRDTSKFLIYGAWFLSEWAGAIKPSLKLVQDINGFLKAIKGGLATYDMATKFLFGRKYTQIIKRQKKENKLFMESTEILREDEKNVA
jgi:capsid protein